MVVEDLRRLADELVAGAGGLCVGGVVGAGPDLRRADTLLLGVVRGDLIPEPLPDEGQGSPVAGARVEPELKTER